MSTHFSTEFSINQEKSVSDVIELAYTWISGSPHTSLKRTDFGEIPVNAETSISKDIEKITIATVNNSAHSLGGLRYTRTDKELEWITSIVSLKTENLHTLSIQVSCEALNITVNLPPPKKPYFIGQAISILGGGMDGEVPVTDKPFILGVGEEAIAALLINGKAQNKLPIVYVSVNFDNSCPLNPDELAKFVAGMAHVVVEPNREFSLKLKNLSSARNAYGGSVTIYWPDSSSKSSYFIDSKTQTPRALQIEIAKNIRLALANKRLVSNCSWPYLIEELSRKKLEALKAQGSTELAEYIEVFDAELDAKEKRIIEADQEIYRLKSELKLSTNSIQSNSSGLICVGSEQEFYPNEIKDIITYALRDKLRATLASSREHHVIEDLLAHNQTSGYREEVENKIKTIFKSYRSLDTQSKSELQKLGFTIYEEGKHFKLIYKGDGRYTYIIAKSASDVRAGKNIASDINNMIFK